MALSLHVAVWHHFLFLISSDKLQDGASMHELAEAVNLLYFARYKPRYLSQFTEYNCNQGVMRKVTLSSKTFV